MNANQDVCEMPDHGLETAAAACCRPSSPAFKGPRPAAPAGRAAAFWRDGAVWRKAARNTFNCLVGCSIGDIGVILYVQAYHPHLSMWVTMGLAMAAGLITSVLLESTLLRFREGLGWRAAVRMAFSMSFLSMLGMELVTNLTDYGMTGGTVAMHHPFYWLALAVSLLAGFLAPLPYNYYQFKRHGRACH